MAPTTSKQWRVKGTGGFKDLALEEAQIPNVGNDDVLVGWKYASLNYRDLIIVRGEYPFPNKKDVVPGSDGAGEVISVGSNVREFKIGDRVASIFGQTFQAGTLKASLIGKELGGMVDGTLQQYSVLPETGLVKIPDTLDFQQAACLACAATTSWNGLTGLAGRQLQAGQWVLTQGTGGVSMFALQFAKAAGARVIATSSSKEKCDKLKKLGADHVINYRETPSWGEEAKKLTGGEGVDHIIEIGGAGTLQQSLAAIKIEGVISIIGFVGGATGDMPSLLSALTSVCTARGVLVGSRQQFQALNAAIDANGIKPVVDEKVFDFKDLPDAYQYMWDQKHFGKLTVKIA